MTDYSESVKALRCKSLSKQCDSCKYGYRLCPDSECNDACHADQIYEDAAAAIEELDAEETRLLLLTSDLQDKLMDLQAEQKKTVTQIFGEEQMAWEGRCKDLMKQISELQAANKELSEELLEAQAKSHWISADIPPKNPNEGVRDEFLVCLENGCVKSLLYEFGYSAPDGYAPLFDEGWHKTWSPVKYWMPLPEPPQEVQDGQ